MNTVVKSWGHVPADFTQENHATEFWSTNRQKSEKLEEKLKLFLSNTVLYFVQLINTLKNIQIYFYNVREKSLHQIDESKEITPYGMAKTLSESWRFWTYAEIL